MTNVPEQHEAKVYIWTTSCAINIPLILRYKHDSSKLQTVLICQIVVLNYSKVLPCIREIKSGHECMYINILAENATFKIGVRFFCMTPCLDIHKNPYAKLIYNPSMHKKTTAWTGK